MNINIICIGKLKERYWTEAAAEYLKRIGGFCSIRVIELKEARLPKNASPADERAVIEKEGDAIIAKISDSDHVIALEVEGDMLDSVALSKRVAEIFASGSSTIDFVIGGSLGLSAAVRKRADGTLSFSRLTFPHQMARIMLLEQIYRSFKIMNGETYHK
jgi:23S rRNA (pseudouridine1915-N3)-methyltransferase